MIPLIINGRDESLDAETPITAFLAARAINPKLVAVARNGEVVQRGDYATTLLRAGDVIEIVRAVGGG
jgi:sulfur carrier protein